MPDAAAAAAEFLRLLAMAALREGEPAILAPRANDALRDVFSQQKNLILDVQFTGFLQKGQLVGNVNPSVLRAAGHLITLRVNRIGFTPDVSEDDLAVFFDAIAKKPAEVAGEGVVGVVTRQAPRGVYVMTSTGEVYRPAAPEKPEPQSAPESTSAEASSTPAAEPDARTADAASPGDAAAAGSASSGSAPAPSTAGGSAAGASADARQGGAFAPLDEDEGFDLSDFELVEDVPELGAPSAGAKPAGAAAGQAPEGGGEVASNEMFHFFRAQQSERYDEEAEALPRLLHEAENATRFDELAQNAVRAALRLVRSQLHAQAVELLSAVVREARRPDRTRLFREAAEQALRRVGTGEPLHDLADLLQYGGEERERILDLFLFLGGDAVPLLENLLFRTPDADLRREVFERLVSVEGMSARLLARVMTDPATARARQILELAALPSMDADLALRWVAESATHPDAAVRTDAARHAAALGGRGGLRVLLDMLNDGDRNVKRSAIQGLGLLGDAAAVPFLTRVLHDASDDDLQIAAIGTLGKIGSAEALPTLITIVNRRALFGMKRMVPVKAAALAAIGRISTPAAREFLQTVAAGKDSDLAPEARRALTSLG